jgi:hypothetical protein
MKKSAQLNWYCWAESGCADIIEGTIVLAEVIANNATRIRTLTSSSSNANCKQGTCTYSNASASMYFEYNCMMD